jgi:hypothetical protein
MSVTQTNLIIGRTRASREDEEMIAGMDGQGKMSQLLLEVRRAIIEVIAGAPETVAPIIAHGVI